MNLIKNEEALALNCPISGEKCEGDACAWWNSYRTRTNLVLGRCSITGICDGVTSLAATTYRQSSAPVDKDPGPSY